MNITRLLAEQNRVFWWFHWRLFWCDLASEMDKRCRMTFSKS